MYILRTAITEKANFHNNGTNVITQSIFACTVEGKWLICISARLWGCYSFQTTFSNENREMPFILPQEVGLVSLHSVPVFVSHSGDYVTRQYTDMKANGGLRVTSLLKCRRLLRIPCFQNTPTIRKCHWMNFVCHFNTVWYRITILSKGFLGTCPPTKRIFQSHDSNYAARPCNCIWGQFINAGEQVGKSDTGYTNKITEEAIVCSFTTKNTFARYIDMTCIVSTFF
jgi:hypothetical protein